MQKSDSAKFVSITASAVVTVPSDIFSPGDPITIYNATTGNITIEQGFGTTLHLVGTSTTGTRVLNQKGLATILCVDTNTFVITGGGLA